MELIMTTDTSKPWLPKYLQESIEQSQDVQDDAANESEPDAELDPAQQGRERKQNEDEQKQELISKNAEEMTNTLNEERRMRKEREAELELERLERKRIEQLLNDAEERERKSRETIEKNLPFDGIPDDLRDLWIDTYGEEGAMIQAKHWKATNVPKHEAIQQEQAPVKQEQHSGSEWVAMVDKLRAEGLDFSKLVNDSDFQAFAESYEIDVDLERGVRKTASQYIIDAAGSQNARAEYGLRKIANEYIQSKQKNEPATSPEVKTSTASTKTKQAKQEPDEAVKAQWNAAINRGDTEKVRELAKLYNF